MTALTFALLIRAKVLITRCWYINYHKYLRSLFFGILAVVEIK